MVPLDWFWCMIGLSFVCLVWLPYIVLHGYLFIGYTFFLAFYLTWKPGHSTRFRSLACWDYFLNTYFAFTAKGPGAHLVNKETVNPQKQYMFAAHPHGLFASYSSFFVLNAHLTHIRCVSTSLQMYIPLIKELVCLGGAIPANKTDIINTLECGDSVMITPGGLREVLTRQETYTQHHGFLKIAKTTNVQVVPVYVKGVKELYSVYLCWPWLQSLVLSSCLYPLIVFSSGHPWVPFWPKKPAKGIELWFGRPRYIRGNIKDEAESFYSTIGDLENEAFNKETK